MARIAAIPRTSRLSILPDDDEDVGQEGTNLFNQAYYEEQIKTNPTGLFNDIMDTLVERDTLRTRVNEIKQSHEEQKNQIKELSEELEELRLELLQALRSNPRDTTPLTSTPRLSAKLPDIAVLSSGEDPTFENWEKNLIAKLSVNADHFNTEEAKMAYLFGRTTGTAQRHLKTRYRSEEGDAFVFFQDMVDCLKNAFVDPFKVRNAKNDYERLVIMPSQKFFDFYTTFLQTARAAQIPESCYIDDLTNKVTFALQEALIPTEGTHATYQDLANHLKGMD
ncbi:hypothetical protein EG329_009729 [Mollisiaceae sp. DMI_Dod_QoI]|nr:hypothetical protein EG329_009729 [Helotiales sp. DMI_Dod_QoI]